jgi:hypothetical protein
VLAAHLIAAIFLKRCLKRWSVPIVKEAAIWAVISV